MYVDLLILSGIVAGAKHGYEIKKNVEHILGRDFSINNNALYPALRKFQEMGAIEKEIQEQVGKPNRHIYRATELGEEILREMLIEFPEEMAGNEAEFQVRIGLFDLIEQKFQMDILKKRESYLEGRFVHFDQLMNLYLQHRKGTYQYELVTFLQDRAKQELEWVNHLMRKCGDGANE